MRCLWGGEICIRGGEGCAGGAPWWSSWSCWAVPLNPGALCCEDDEGHGAPRSWWSDRLCGAGTGRVLSSPVFLEARGPCSLLPLAGPARWFPVSASRKLGECAVFALGDMTVGSLITGEVGPLGARSSEMEISRLVGRLFLRLLGGDVVVDFGAGNRVPKAILTGPSPPLFSFRPPCWPPCCSSSFTSGSVSGLIWFVASLSFLTPSWSRTSEVSSTWVSTSTPWG